MHKVMRERAKERLSAYAAWVVVASCGSHGVRAYAVARLVELATPPETLGAMAGRLRCHVCGGPAVGVLLKPRPDSPERDCVWVRYPPGAAPAPVSCGHHRAAWWSGYVKLSPRRSGW
jgi:hypothetical protein